MLTVRFETKDACETAMRALGVEGKPEGANFVMYEDGAPKAIMRTHFEAEGEHALIIDFVKFADGVDEGDKKFFLHAMFFKFREGAPVLLRADADKMLEPFGFERKGDKFELYSGDINLYYNCGGRLNG